MYPYIHKAWNRCNDKMITHDKIICHYFTLVKYEAKHVPEGCICYVPQGGEILLYYPMVKVCNAGLRSVFTTFSTIHDQEITPLNKYVYVLYFCFTEDLLTPIFVEGNYGIYDAVILEYINNLKSPLL